MSAICGPHCGFCGRCTAAWEREPESPVLCDSCHCILSDPDGDALVTPFGTFCSDECAAKEEAEFRAHLARQGFMVVNDYVRRRDAENK